MNFRAKVQLEGKTATGIEVPAEVLEAMGPKKRVPVRVTINGYTYRTTVAPMSGRFFIPLSAENRNGAGVAAGDEIEVGIEPDNDPREVAVPDDFAAALDADPAVRAFFDGLSYSNRRRFVMGIDEAKSPETRQRRIHKSVEMLREGKVP